MFANYFYLRRHISELKSILKGSVISEIFSQQKNILSLKIPSETYPDRHLIISLNSTSPYLYLKNEFHKAKKNYIDLFTDNIPVKIFSIRIAENDRIIQFDTDNGFLLFAIQGTKTNFYCFNQQMKEEKFKKTDYSVLETIKRTIFSDDIQFSIDDTTSSSLDFESLLKEYPMVRGILKNEIKYRGKKSASVNILGVFNNIVEDILYKKIKVGYNSDLSKAIFIPESFESIDTQSDTKIFSDYNSAFNYYNSLNSRKNDLSQVSNELGKYFDKELSQLANKINKLKFRVDEGSRENEYYQFGNLLLANIHNIKKGLKEVTLNDYTSGKNVEIKIDPKIAPHDNVNKYFEKAKDEKINYNKSAELLKFSISKYELLKTDFEKFEKSTSLEELKEIHRKYIRKKDNSVKMESGEKFRYWHFKIEDKYDVFIGRDSKSNDYLSIKFAKQNDYWFHARGLPGSHVVLRVENVKEGIPKNIIKKAASLAAYYSKAKTAGSAPVSYTLAKFVYKKKGMLPGKVMLTKENTLMVKPEIPKQVELINE